jgi:hypothetical protein
MRTLLLQFGLALMIPTALAAQTPKELAAAMATLEKNGSYRWESKTTMEGGPEAAKMEIIGACELSVGWMTKSNVNGQEIAAAGIGGKRAATIGKEWSAAHLFPGKDEKAVRAREMMGLALPHDELAKAANAAAKWTRQADESWVGAVDTAVAREMVAEAMRERGMPAAAIKALKCKSSRLQVWTASGLPVGYRLDYEVEISLGFMKKTMKRSTHTTLSAFGKTKLHLPDDAKTAMTAAVP